MKLRTLTSTLCALGVAGSLQAQVTIFSESFDPLSAGANLQVGYSFGDTTSSSSGIGTGTGLTGDSWRVVNTAASGANGFSGVGAQYQNGGITGNTSANLSDYTLSFDAMADGGSLNIQIETWTGAGFGGSLTGKLNTAPASPGFGNDQTLNGVYTHYSLNLGDTGVFMDDTGIDISGGTIQITMQYNGGGATPYSYTMDIDNLTLAMVPEPATFALAGLGLAGLVVFRRRRK